MKRAAFFSLVAPFLFATLAWSAPAAAQGAVTFGGGASAQSGGDGSASRAAAAAGEGAGTDSAKEWAERDQKMNEAATLTGGVGLVHTQHAQGGAVGQFRVGFTTEFFSDGFLCSQTFPCRDPRGTGSLTSDANDHVGGRLTLSMQVLKWL
jgi:hypothetical protein